NDGLDILINGVSTHQSNTAQFSGFTPFQITNGFQGAINRLTFVLSNGRGEPSGNGPTGLRVEMCGTASPTAVPFLRSVGLDPRGRGMIITWGSLRNRTYHVRYKENLADERWFDLVGDVLARGSTASK